MQLTIRQKFIRAIKRHPDLIAYWPFNEVTGTTARNYAPATKGSHNGTIAGSLDLGQAGKIGRHFSNDANTSKRVSVAFNSTLAPAIFSICFLTRSTPNHQSGGTNIVAAHRVFDVPPAGRGWHFRVNGTTGSVIQWGVSFDDATKQGDFVLTNNTWNFLVLTYDGTNIRTYRNGTLIETAAGGTTYQPMTTANIEFFSSFGGYNGDIQHFAIFSDDLSASEITELARIAGVA